MQRSLITAVCSVALIIVGALYFSAKRQPTVPSDKNTKATVLVVTERRQIPDGLREYKNIPYNFSLFYPKGLTVSEHAEGEGASTVTFQNVENKEGFQIFIIPYSKPIVSEERFARDVPSGIRLDLKDVKVDGVVGAAFYSTNPSLGETREVWVIHLGYLYEVTTLKALDSWLDDIIKTWKFIN